MPSPTPPPAPALLPPANDAPAGILTLAARADPLADPAPLSFFRAHRDCPVEVNAAKLRHFSGALAEMLLVVSADHRARGIPITITGLAPHHIAQLELLGLAAHLPIGLPLPAGQPA